MSFDISGANEVSALVESQDDGLFDSAPPFMPSSIASIAPALGLISQLCQVSIGAPGQPVAPTLFVREQFTLLDEGAPKITLQLQGTKGPSLRADVVYVHGSSFGADLSIFFAFDGRSWADHLNEAGHAVWGFDFVGYGRSARYPARSPKPPGDIDDAMQDLRRVVAAIRQRNGDKPVVLLAHSRGGVVAARYASEHTEQVDALVLFAPVVTRHAEAGVQPATTDLPSHVPLSAWAQYRRFIADVPPDQPQVLSEAHMQAWSEAFLDSDPSNAERVPRSVMTPTGPMLDAGKLWSGQSLYKPANITAATLLVRGEWDSACTNADAKNLLDSLTAARVKVHENVPRATHLMHLEQQRTMLYARVNHFLQKVLQ